MSQHDYSIDNASGSAVRSDLNNALGAIATANSGATAPSTTYAYMLWADTANTKLKMRNGANSAWIEVGALDTANLGLVLASLFANVTGNVTSTHTELNILDGVTATTAELNILEGVTSSASELNTLDGITSSTTELNLLDGGVYPVGAIFTTVTAYADSAAVVAAIGGTTWEAFGAGKVLVGVDTGDSDFDTVEETGGSKTHTLTTSEIPSHTHTIDLLNDEDQAGGGSGACMRGSSKTYTTDATGGGGSHNNVQPYITVYMWKRTA